MADRNSTGVPPAFLLSPIRPVIVRGSLVYQTGDVLFPTFRQAASAWSAAESHRLDLVDIALELEDRLQAKHTAQDAPPERPIRRCQDCRLHLGTQPGDTLRAAFACPLFGKPRIGVESRCSSFVAKVAKVGGAS